MASQKKSDETTEKQKLLTKIVNYLEAINKPHSDAQAVYSQLQQQPKVTIKPVIEQQIPEMYRNNRQSFNNSDYYHYSDNHYTNYYHYRRRENDLHLDDVYYPNYEGYPHEYQTINYNHYRQQYGPYQPRRYPNNIYQPPSSRWLRDVPARREYNCRKTDYHNQTQLKKECSATIVPNEVSKESVSVKTSSCELNKKEEAVSEEGSNTDEVCPTTIQSSSSSSEEFSKESNKNLDEPSHKVNVTEKANSSEIVIMCHNDIPAIVHNDIPAIVHNDIPAIVAECAVDCPQSAASESSEVTLLENNSVQPVCSDEKEHDENEYTENSTTRSEEAKNLKTWSGLDTGKTYLHIDDSASNDSVSDHYVGNDFVNKDFESDFEMECLELSEDEDDTKLTLSESDSAEVPSKKHQCNSPLNSEALLMQITQIEKVLMSDRMKQTSSRSRSQSVNTNIEETKSETVADKVKRSRSLCSMDGSRTPTFLTNDLSSHLLALLSLRTSKVQPQSYTSNEDLLCLLSETRSEEEVRLEKEGQLCDITTTGSSSKIPTKYNVEDEPKTARKRTLSSELTRGDNIMAKRIHIDETCHTESRPNAEPLAGIVENEAQRNTKLDTRPISVKSKTTDNDTNSFNLALYSAVTSSKTLYNETLASINIESDRKNHVSSSKLIVQLTDNESIGGSKKQIKTMVSGNKITDIGTVSEDHKNLSKKILVILKKDQFDVKIQDKVPPTKSTVDNVIPGQTGNTKSVVHNNLPAKSTPIILRRNTSSENQEKVLPANSNILPFKKEWFILTKDKVNVDNIVPETNCKLNVVKSTVDNILPAKKVPMRTSKPTVNNVERRKGSMKVSKKQMRIVESKDERSFDLFKDLKAASKKLAENKVKTKIFMKNAVPVNPITQVKASTSSLEKMSDCNDSSSSSSSSPQKISFSGDSLSPSSSSMKISDFSCSRRGPRRKIVPDKSPAVDVSTAKVFRKELEKSTSENKKEMVTKLSEKFIKLSDYRKTISPQSEAPMSPDFKLDLSKPKAAGSVKSRRKTYTDPHEVTMIRLFGSPLRDINCGENRLSIAKLGEDVRQENRNKQGQSGKKRLYTPVDYEYKSMDKANVNDTSKREMATENERKGHVKQGEHSSVKNQQDQDTDSSQINLSTDNNKEDLSKCNSEKKCEKLSLFRRNLFALPSQQENSAETTSLNDCDKSKGQPRTEKEEAHDKRMSDKRDFGKNLSASSSKPNSSTDRPNEDDKLKKKVRTEKESLEKRHEPSGRKKLCVSLTEQHNSATERANVKVNSKSNLRTEKHSNQSGSEKKLGKKHSARKNLCLSSTVQVNSAMTRTCDDDSSTTIDSNKCGLEKRPGKEDSSRKNLCASPTEQDNSATKVANDEDNFKNKDSTKKGSEKRLEMERNSDKQLLNKHSSAPLPLQIATQVMLPINEFVSKTATVTSLSDYVYEIVSPLTTDSCSTVNAQSLPVLLDNACLKTVSVATCIVVDSVEIGRQKTTKDSDMDVILIEKKPVIVDLTLDQDNVNMEPRVSVIVKEKIKCKLEDTPGESSGEAIPSVGTKHEEQVPITNAPAATLPNISVIQPPNVSSNRPQLEANSCDTTGQLQSRIIAPNGMVSLIPNPSNVQSANEQHSFGIFYNNSVDGNIQASSSESNLSSGIQPKPIELVSSMIVDQQRTVSSSRYCCSELNSSGGGTILSGAASHSSASAAVSLATSTAVPLNSTFISNGTTSVSSGINIVRPPNRCVAQSLFPLMKPIEHDTSISLWLMQNHESVKCITMLISKYIYLLSNISKSERECNKVLGSLMYFKSFVKPLMESNNYQSIQRANWLAQLFAKELAEVTGHLVIVSHSCGTVLDGVWRTLRWSMHQSDMTKSWMYLCLDRLIDSNRGVFKTTPFMHGLVTIVDNVLKRLCVKYSCMTKKQLETIELQINIYNGINERQRLLFQQQAQTTSRLNETPCNSSSLPTSNYLYHSKPASSGHQSIVPSMISRNITAIPNHADNLRSSNVPKTLPTSLPLNYSDVMNNYLTSYLRDLLSSSRSRSKQTKQSSGNNVDNFRIRLPLSVPRTNTHISPPTTTTTTSAPNLTSSTVSNFTMPPISNNNCVLSPTVNNYSVISSTVTNNSVLSPTVTDNSVLSPTVTNNSVLSPTDINLPLSKDSPLISGGFPTVTNNSVLSPTVINLPLSKDSRLISGGLNSMKPLTSSANSPLSSGISIPVSVGDCSSAKSSTSGGGNAPVSTSINPTPSIGAIAIVSSEITLHSTSSIETIPSNGKASAKAYNVDRSVSLSIPDNVDLAFNSLEQFEQLLKNARTASTSNETFKLEVPIPKGVATTADTNCEAAAMMETSEVKVESDNNTDDVIDLTWLDDVDVNELENEMKRLPLKEEVVQEVTDQQVEVDKENDAQSVNMMNRNVNMPSPVDSGIDSPPLRVDVSELVFRDRKCFCGKSAEYVCRCMYAIYCSTSCQRINWQSHKIECNKYCTLYNSNDNSDLASS